MLMLNTLNKDTQNENKESRFHSFRKWFARWGLISFISGWMFIIGVLVGRGTIPPQFDTDKLRSELIGIKNAMIRKEMKRFHIDPSKDDVRTDLGFPEELKKNHTDNEWKPRITNTTQPELSEEIPETPSTAPPVTAPQSKHKKEDPKSENKMAKPKETVKPPEVPTPQSSEPESDKKGIAIQVASFKDASIADKKIEELKAKGFSAYRVSGEVPGQGTWYRIRIGTFKTKEEAKVVMEKLRASKFNPMIVSGQ